MEGAILRRLGRGLWIWIGVEGIVVGVWRGGDDDAVNWRMTTRESIEY